MNYPLDTQDVRRQRLTNMASFYEHAQDACFDLCEDKKSDLTFLSIKEGKCLRNCVMKIGYLMPAVQKSFGEGDAAGF